MLSVKPTDTGGEFGVVPLFMGKTARPVRVHREIRSGEGREGQLAGRAGEFATSVPTLTDTAPGVGRTTLSFGLVV